MRPGEPAASNVDVCLPSGFSPNRIYDLVYEAQDPIVMGIGFAAIRDFVSFLRYDATDSNPIVARGGGATSERSPIKWVIAFGQSQGGRIIRDFIYQGFNQDLTGRMVFDGAIPTTAGSFRTFTNLEFSQPGVFARAVEDHYAPGNQFPFTYETMTDPVSRIVDGLFMNCRTTGSCPKIMQWDSGAEFWGPTHPSSSPTQLAPPTFRFPKT